jgi:hypothetical protein
MTKLSYLSLALAIVSAADSFAPALLSSSPVSRRAALSPSRLYEDKKDTTEAVFVPPPPTEEDSEASTDDIPLEAAESLGRGAAKVQYEPKNPL